jgi:uncharacterized protein YegL
VNLFFVQVSSSAPDQARRMCSEHVLPFYVVCDVSCSMTDHLDALNAGLFELHRAVGTDPVVADRTRFCLIGFSESPEVLLPLSRLSEITEISRLVARAATNFGATFTLLRKLISQDIDLLKGQSNQVYRPAVFFLSDGQPTDPVTWPAAYAALTDPAWPTRPNVIAFGVGDADPATIGRIGTFRAFMGQDGVSPGAALSGFARALTASILRSGNSSSGSDEIVLRVPEHISGFVPLRVDPV